MPRKGMRSLLFSSKISSSGASSSSDPFSSPSRFGFSPGRPTFYESVMDRTLDIVEPIIVKWDTESSAFGRVTSLFYESKKEAKDFIKCVNNLHRAMQFLVAENSVSDKMVRAQNLMQMAMKRLQKEFYQILSTNRVYLDPESVSTRSSHTSAASSVSDYDEYDDEGEDDDVRLTIECLTKVEDAASVVMTDLRLIAECMISSGYAKECLKIYKILRKSIVDEGIYRLGVEKFSSNQVHKMQWDTLEPRIKKWLNAVRTAVKTLFNGERILCDHVFGSSNAIRESCFTEITIEGAMILFGFPENVAKNTKKSPEKVFRLLDMYNGIADQWTDIESMFSFQSTADIKSQALTSLARLSEYVRTSINDLESSISKTSSKSPAAGAGIHHLTTHVMNYLSILSDYSSILTEIYADSNPQTKTPLPESYFGFSVSDESSPVPAITQKLAWIILVLLCKLDSEARHYKDISQAYLFLANNLQKVVTKVRTSNLIYLLGDNWLTKHEAKVKQFASQYERLGWGQVIDALPSDPAAEKIPETIKEIFKNFNTSFERAYQRHTTLVIPDNHLRDAMKASIARKIFRLYYGFYNVHVTSINGMENKSSAIRFTPEDVRNRLSHLFSRDIETGTSLGAISSIE